MPKGKIDVVVISVSSPLQIGIYENGKLAESIIKEGKSSDLLPVVFRDILHRYAIKRIFYAKGPGSFMAIKIAYVFLKTLCITKKIRLYASDAFVFNGNAPIKSVGKSYFIKTKSGIEIKKMEEAIPMEFHLPNTLDTTLFNEDVKPMYIAPAV